MKLIWSVNQLVKNNFAKQGIGQEVGLAHSHDKD